MTNKIYAPSWDQANAMGVAEASYLIAKARETDNPCLIAARIRAMGPAEDGQDVGFIFRLAQAAMNGV